MTIHNRFLIRNDSGAPLTLNIEPEGAFFPLSQGEEVSVSDAFTSAPVTIKFSNADNGAPILSLWPGDMRVEKDGVDVFDLLQQAVEVS